MARPFTPTARHFLSFGAVTNLRKTPLRWSSTSASTPSNRAHAVAFVGLGAMGREMANNLFSKTYLAESRSTFFVCDAFPEAAAAFARSFAEKYPTAEVVVVDTPGE